MKGDREEFKLHHAFYEGWRARQWRRGVLSGYACGTAEDDEWWEGYFYEGIL